MGLRDGEGFSPFLSSFFFSYEDHERTYVGSLSFSFFSSFSSFCFSFYDVNTTYICCFIIAPSSPSICP